MRKNYIYFDGQLYLTELPGTWAAVIALTDEDIKTLGLNISEELPIDETEAAKNTSAEIVVDLLQEILDLTYKVNQNEI